MSQFPNYAPVSSASTQQYNPGQPPASAPVAAPYQGAPSQPIGNPAGVQGRGFGGAPNGGGRSLFAGKQFQPRNMGGKVFLSCGTYWAVIRQAYRHRHGQTGALSNFMDLTVIRILDAGIGQHIGQERPMSIGQDFNHCISEKALYGSRDINKIAYAMLGVDAQSAEELVGYEAAIYDQKMIDTHIAEVRGYVYVTKTGKRMIFTDFVRRVPWQEAAKVLDAAEQQRFFGGTLDQLAQKEAAPAAQGGLGVVVAGWQPGITGPGAGKEPAALAAQQYQPSSFSPGGFAAAAPVQTYAPPAAQYASPAQQGGYGQHPGAVQQGQSFRQQMEGQGYVQNNQGQFVQPAVGQPPVSYAPPANAQPPAWNQPQR